MAATVPVVLQGIEPATFGELLSRALAAVGDRTWSECDGLTLEGMSIRLNSWQFVLELPEATLFFEQTDAMVRATPGPAGVLSSWIRSTRHAVEDGSDECIRLRSRLNEAARLMMLACILAGRPNAIGWADNVLDNIDDTPRCRFGWHEDGWSFAAPSELTPLLEGTSPAYRSYGVSPFGGDWTIARDRMAIDADQLDAMWMLRNTSRIPPPAIERLRRASFRRYRRVF